MPGAAVEEGFGAREDLEHIEDRGRIEGAETRHLSPKAISRGRPQLGTLGSGNHFVEVGYVGQVLHEETARAFGLEAGKVTVAVHTGSRGFGHQVCDDHLRVLSRPGLMRELGIPDRQLCCAKIHSSQGQFYLSAMAAAANFAFANRQIIGHHVAQAFQKTLKKVKGDIRIRLLYDLAHNIAKFEDHEVDGETRRLLVHRKGATRAFPPDHPDLAHPLHRKFGQPVFIPRRHGPGTRTSWPGRRDGAKLTFGSSAHGAGRRMSRHQAKKSTTHGKVLADLTRRKVRIRAASKGTLVEEMPEAYKDVADVIGVVERVGLGLPVARIRPLIVIKG